MGDPRRYVPVLDAQHLAIVVADAAARGVPWSLTDIDRALDSIAVDAPDPHPEDPR